MTRSSAARARWRPLASVLAVAAFAVFGWASTAQAQQSPSIEVAPDETPIAPAPQGDAAWGGAVRDDVQSVAGVRVEMRGLDKLTGDVRTFGAIVGSAVMYERMMIEVRACYAQQAAQAPESSVFLQVYDTKYNPAPVSFSGWMFASSPALSAMDHPRYDIWVLSCSTS